MDIRELKISGAWEITPRQFPDDRGLFLEAYKSTVFEQVIGHRLDVRQANTSVSKAGTVRGIHFADVPPSQAKYVMCPRGAVLDFAVDIRVGSPPSVSGTRFFSTTSTAAPSTSPRASATSSWHWRITPPWCTCAPRSTRLAVSTASTRCVLPWESSTRRWIATDSRWSCCSPPRTPMPQVCSRLRSKVCFPPGRPARSSSPR